MPIDPELTRRIAASMARNGGIKTAVAKDLGIARQTVIDHAKLIEPRPEPEAVLPGKMTRKTVGDTQFVEFATDKLIETDDQAIAHAKIDLAIWDIAEIELSYWQVPMKVGIVGADGKRASDQPHVKQMCGVRLKLKRRLPKEYQIANDLILERIKEVAPRYDPIEYARPATPHLLEIDLFDVHFGKLAWHRETGEDYDLKIAERLFRDAVVDILARASGYGIEKIVIPIGNDFFHVDGLKGETTAGTPQDTDGRYHKMIEVGEMALIWAVEACRRVAPVDLLHVPGNHDRLASWNACRTLWGRFFHCPDVKVDFEPKARKYLLYGKTLIGWTHGSDEKTDKLPGIMSDEAPKLCAEAQFKEWHRGHMHRAKSFQYNPVDTVDGVRIRDLQSLSGRDAWHYLKGYCGGKRAAEAFLFCRDTGDVHSFEVSMRATG